MEANRNVLFDWLSYMSKVDDLQLHTAQSIGSLSWQDNEAH